MEILTQNGYPFGFNPVACESCGGHCCTGESGYIWVDEATLERIALFTQCELKEFVSRFCVKIGARFSLKEYALDDGFACIFFDARNRRCSIYPVRPEQCRTFPFWDYFKRYPHKAHDECPGILPL